MDLMGGLDSGEWTPRFVGSFLAGVCRHSEEMDESLAQTT